MVGRLSSGNGRKDWTKYPTQVQKSIAYQELANGDSGGEVAVAMCCLCLHHQYKAHARGLRDHADDTARPDLRT
jgi:hypothetical protein